MPALTDKPSPTYLNRLAKLEARIAALPSYVPPKPGTFWLDWKDNPRLRQEYLGALTSYVEWQEREAKPKKVKPAKVRYFATHEGGLHNGSFFRLHIKDGRLAQFVNGDYMGSTPEEFISAGPLRDGVPTTYGGSALIEYPEAEAERLIPHCNRPGN
jgi:hypothetical protein